MNKNLKKLLKKIIVAMVLFVLAFLPLSVVIKMVLLAFSYLLVGWPIIAKALRNIRNGQVFDENFLMMIATLGAIALGEYSEAVAVMLFFQIGEFFQSYAVNQSRKSIAALMDIRPDYAHVKRGDKLETVSPEEVVPGEVIVIRPGERVPLDGKVITGESILDTAALTGEAMPRDVAEGDEVISGCINLTGVLEVVVSKEFANSTVAKILDLVENASTKKAEMENFITRFARYYTPAVVIIALFLAVIPPLFLASQSFHEWVYRAITFLVISCPCALVISIPLSFFGGLGAASRAGVLIKGSNYLEALAHAEIIVFDKTGTLTKGQFLVAEYHPEQISEAELLEYAAYAEAYSTHPIAESIKKAFGKKLDLRLVSKVQEMHGHGVEILFDGKKVAAGNIKLMKRLGIDADEAEGAGTAIYVAVDKKYAGYLLIEDEIKEDAFMALPKLKEVGLKNTVMLTGDRQAIGENVGWRLGLDKVYAELLPADKVEVVEALLNEKSKNGKLLFVGDGINDAPVLARADIGIAMGGIGSDAAIEAADVVIMTDEPSKIVTAIKIARKTLAIAQENIVFAIGVKLLVLALGALGYVSIWAAVFADVGVSVLAILNAVRILAYRPMKC